MSRYGVEGVLAPSRPGRPDPRVCPPARGRPAKSPVGDNTEVERDRTMAVDGRRVGRLHGKRHAELLTNGAARQALKRAIEAEGATYRDVWGNGYVEGLHDALSELEGKGNLAGLDWDD